MDTEMTAQRYISMLRPFLKIVNLFEFIKEILINKRHSPLQATRFDVIQEQAKFFLKGTSPLIADMIFM